MEIFRWIKLKKKLWYSWIILVVAIMKVMIFSTILIKNLVYISTLHQRLCNNYSLKLWYLLTIFINLILDLEVNINNLFIIFYSVRILFIKKNIKTNFNFIKDLKDDNIVIRIRPDSVTGEEKIEFSLIDFGLCAYLNKE